MDKVMDAETAEHFYAWLDRFVPVPDQHGVESAIHSFLKLYPELPAEGRSWPEIRMLAERYVQS